MKLPFKKKGSLTKKKKGKFSRIEFYIICFSPIKGQTNNDYKMKVSRHTGGNDVYTLTIMVTFFSKFFFTLETQKKKKIGVFLYHMAMEKKTNKEI
jgi:hypothetical protein